MRKVPSLRLRIGFVLDDALALLMIFEIIALGQLALYPFSLYTVGSFAWYQAQMFRWLVSLSPILLILLLYAWLARLILRVARKRSIRVNKFIQFLSELVRTRLKQNSSPEQFIILRYPGLLLVLAMTVAGLLACVAYLPGLNPNGNPVGLDTPTYIDWTRQMLARPFPQAISYAFSGADQGFRPLPLILFYSIASLGVTPEQTVEFSPLIQPQVAQQEGEPDVSQLQVFQRLVGEFEMAEAVREREHDPRGRIEQTGLHIAGEAQSAIDRRIPLREAPLPDGLERVIRQGIMKLVEVIGDVNAAPERCVFDKKRRREQQREDGDESGAH